MILLINWYRSNLIEKQLADRDLERCRGEGGSLLLKGIDVNRLPSGVDCEEEAGVSSPNSTVSSVSGKRSEREYNDMERACSRGISDEEDAETARKKLRLTKDQSIVLEESFKEHNTLSPVSRPTIISLTRFSNLFVCLLFLI